MPRRVIAGIGGVDQVQVSHNYSSVSKYAVGDQSELLLIILDSRLSDQNRDRLGADIANQNNKLRPSTRMIDQQRIIFRAAKSSSMGVVDYFRRRGTSPSFSRR